MVAIESDMTVTKQQHRAVLYVAPKERLEKIHPGEFCGSPVLWIQCCQYLGPEFNSRWGTKICKSLRVVKKKKKVTNKKIQKSLSNSSYCLVCSKVFYCNSFEIEAADISKWQTMESQCFLLFTKTNTIILSGQKVSVNKIIRQSTSCISFNTMNVNQ